ncbi:MAG TPA: TonB family protein [Burkholderiaceae bacterium]|nr:TonB family protein [Burkholderiaceae bacterium]
MDRLVNGRERRSRLRPMDLRVALAAALLVLSAGGSAQIRDDELERYKSEYGLGRAVDAVKQGDYARAVQILEKVAEVSNARAALLLGTMYLENKGVAPDPIRGIAWLQVAQEWDRSADRWVAQHAEQAMLAAQAGLNGATLIAADRLTGQLLADARRRQLAQIEIGVRQYTDAALVTPGAVVKGGYFLAEEPVQLRLPTSNSDSPLVRLGCASSPSFHCPDGLKGTHDSRCHGLIARTDTSATSNGNHTQISMAGSNWAPGSVTLLAHVDSSGGVCSVVLMESSGTSVVDRTAAEAVSMWRLQPARRNGEAVESLLIVTIDVL